MYAVKFQTKQCKSTTGYSVSHEGQWHWIVREPEGWVWATSQSAAFDSKGICLAGDAKIFKTHEEAEKAIKRWEKEYHPWYGEPNGVYEIVKVKPIYITVLQGYELE